MSLKTKYILTFLLFLAAACFHAQSQDLNIKFSHLSFKDGLAQSPISSITTDKKGFIWLGNWKGLSRYDGYEFRNFRHDPTNFGSISSNRVNSICVDHHGFLWVGTANGLNKYDPVKESFKRIDIQNVKGGRNYISSVFQDSYRQLWVTTFAGVKLVDTVKSLLKDVNVSDEPIGFTLFEDRQHTIWLGTKKGLRRFDPKSKKSLPLPSAIASSEVLMNAKILVVRQDRQGILWFGTETSGVFSYNPVTAKLEVLLHDESNKSGLLSNWIRDIYIYDRENIWIGTRNGLSIYNTRLKTFKNHVHNPLDPDGLSDGTIWSFMQDRASGIWIGTFAGGLNVYYPSNANFENLGERMGQRMGLSHPVVNALQEDQNGGLWVGTYGGGINYLNRGKNTYEYHAIKNGEQSRNGVKSLALDNTGNLWIGTLDGLCLMNKDTRKIKFYNFDIKQGKFSEKLINAIVPEDGGAWVGTNGGGLKHLFRDGTYKTYTHQPTGNGVSDNFVTSLLKDASGNLWIGTQNGLNYFDRRKNHFTRYNKSTRPFYLNNSSIITLFKDSKDRLWIGTEGGGLNYRDAITGKFYALNAKEHLTDDVIHTIVEDEDGHIWLSTDNGLYKLKFKEFKLPFSSGDIQITHYDANDGLASNQFSTSSGIRLSSGELLFGGINGLTSFFPDKIRKNTLKPQVVLTEFLVRNKTLGIDSVDSALKHAIGYTKKVELKYDQGYITIKFAALNFINPEKNSYAYKLEGLSGEDWHYSGPQRVVNYTNLEPGDYVFQVIASNNDGVWNRMPTRLSITILPPWWQTWWAYLIYFALSAFVAHAVYRFLKYRARLKQELYLEQLQNERQEELHQLKIDFFTNISHELRTPLTLILGPLEKMVQSAGAAQHGLQKQLLQVQTNASRLMRLVTELMDFRKADSGNMKLMFSNCNMVHFAEEIFLSFQSVAEEKGINYSFNASAPELMVYFDKDHFEKVLFNLLSNAFKFTPAFGKIEVAVVGLDDWVEITIRDNGKGIDPQHIPQLFNKFFQVKEGEHANQGYGIGLALSKSIVELHGGKIEVKSDVSGSSEPETAFKVSLKTGTAHLDESKLVPEYMNSDNPVHYYLQSQAGTLLIADTDKAVAEVRSDKQTLLIIEDNAELRTFIRESFEEGYNILEADNGQDGLNMVLDKMPDLVISDVMMPGMDGLELCRRVKTNERVNHIPVILLTARAAYIHQVNGLEKGADAYITKPFSIQVLELNVKNILATKEALKQKFSKEFILTAPLKEATSVDEKFLQKFMEIVESHLDDTAFDVSTIAQEIGMSKTVLYKKVQAITNMTVADLIKSIRLKSAAAMLEQNKMSIADIAFSVGFNDRKYFSKEFKKLYKLSPSEYVALHSTSGSYPEN